VERSTIHPSSLRSTLCFFGVYIMTIQYIEFSTMPDGRATIWDNRESAPSDAVAIDSKRLAAFIASPAPRFAVEYIGGQSYQIVCKVEGWEVCNINDHSDLQQTTCEQIARLVCDALNASPPAQAMHFDCEPEGAGSNR
jgi:hypothetical protein